MDPSTILEALGMMTSKARPAVLRHASAGVPG